jgi:hypothetical protein
VEEKIFWIGMGSEQGHGWMVLVQGLAILKASMQSKTVLTDVFLHGKAVSPGGRATRSRS